jgi:hypothetical protein
MRGIGFRLKFYKECSLISGINIIFFALFYY